MLKIASLFWAAPDKSALTKKFEALGFTLAPSRHDPKATAIYFGPDALEFVEGKSGFTELSLESDDIIADYRRIKAAGIQLDKPQKALDQKGSPLWFRFGLPSNATPVLRAGVIMDSPESVKKLSLETLPKKYSNSCFGIEAVHLAANDPKIVASSWGKILDRQPSGLGWNEGVRTEAFRVQAGERFLDTVSTKAGLSKAEGVFMITLKVTDLEGAMAICEKVGAHIQRCSSRDGFIVDGSFTGGPALRFVRAFWKAYLVPTSQNFPQHRRTDGYRPLGGADSTTLVDGFEDNWNF